MSLQIKGIPIEKQRRERRNKLKILLTGAAGMLASAVISEVEKSGNEIFGSTIEIIKSDINLRLPDIQKVDISNLNNAEDWVRSEKPDFIFHLAAETDVDLCEINPEHAYKTNYIGTENIALICQKYDIPCLYISTAGVFCGDKIEPYNEFDKPHPINIYGWSKLYGEIIIKQLLNKYFIVRAGWMVGGWEIDKKFVYKIVCQLSDGKKEINVVNDKYGTPTFTADFAKNLLPLIRTNRYGLYHMANKGSATRYDIANKIVEFMNLNGKVKVNPISSAEFPLPAQRGRSEMIHNLHLELIGLNNMPPWQESLEKYIKTNIKG